MRDGVLGGKVVLAGPVISEEAAAVKVVVVEASVGEAELDAEEVSVAVEL